MFMADKKIVMVNIMEERYLNVINVRYDDGTEEKRLDVYYPDELYVNGADLIDLTRQEALDLISSKNTAYLRS